MNSKVHYRIHKRPQPVPNQNLKCQYTRMQWPSLYAYNICHVSCQLSERKRLCDISTTHFIFAVPECNSLITLYNASGLNRKPADTSSKELSISNTDPLSHE
jgi:hypothetical protein